MADLKALLKNAQKDADDAKRNVENLGKVRSKIDTFDQNGTKAIELYAAGYPDSLPIMIEENAAKLETYTAAIQDTSISLQRKVEKAKNTLALLTKSADNGYMDATSRRMMLDYADMYKVTYLVVCAKVVLFVVVMCIIYSRRNLVLTIAATVLVVVVWYSWKFTLYFFNNLKSRESQEGKLCSDGTPSNATGSNCKDSCATKGEKTPIYRSCEQSPFGCCNDGSPSIDVNGTTCNGPLACATSRFGCCPDGLSERTDISGSKCDWTYFSGDCSSSMFGCCPNGSIKQDEDGSNCTMNSACGMSAFGCCPDGQEQVDLAGSNCT